jgi:hypothetical protein
MKLFLAIAVVVSGVTLALLPAPALVLPADPAAPPFVRGAVHVHTDRSDGTGTFDTIAEAAARAGLHFVVFTDHGDAAQEPVPPSYRHGVLCIDGVEISTDAGHVVALGLPRAPYPLGGQVRDVIEDIHRLGGMAIAAHPSSPRESLRWSDPEATFDGIEWLNGDSQWRDERVPTLGRTLLTYWLRPAESLGQLLDRPVEAMAMWDEATRTRPVVGLAAADAHARIGLRGVGEPYDDRPVGRLPGYEGQFRTFSIAVPGRLSGTAAADATFVVDAIEQGRVVSVVDALASPGWLEFTATSGQARAEQGGELRPDDGEREISLHVRAPVVPGARLRVIRDGREVGTESLERPVRMDFGIDPATFRVEVTLPGAPGMPPVPWLVSNPIYVRAATPSRPGPRSPVPATPTAAPPTRESEVDVTGTAAQWTVEHTVKADGRITEVRAKDGAQLLARWALGGTENEPASVAIARSLTLSAGDYDALALTANASRPMRVSVQLRTATAPGGRRWARSIYLDDTPREIRLPLQEFVPVGHDMPIGDAMGLDSLLFVIDHVNGALGSSGMFWLDHVRFVGAPQVRTESRR